MNCCICSNQATVEIKYEDSLGKTITEKRCNICVKAVRENTDNTIINEKLLCSTSSEDDDSNEEELKPLPPARKFARTAHRRRRLHNRRPVFC